MRFYGAFFVNTKSDNSMFTNNEHNLSDAESQGMIGCKIVSPKKYENDCILYATVVPTGRPIGKTQTSETLSMEASIGFKKFIKFGKSGEYSAFAINSATAWAWSKGQQTAALAQEFAIKHCQNIADNSLAVIPDAHKNAIRRKGGFKCRVVFTKLTK